MEWFQITEVDKDIFVIVEPEHVQCYLVKGKKLSALIDTGMGFSNIRSAIEPLIDTGIIVLNTHWHYDHTGGNRLFKEIGISEIEMPLIEKDFPNDVLMEIYIEPCRLEGIPFPADFVPEKYEVRGSKATFSLADGDTFDLGGRILEAAATPGHTHGSMSIIDGLTGNLFCGDLIYRGSIYAHLDESDLDAYVDTLQKLMRRYDEIKTVFTGHNAYAMPKTFLASVLEGFLQIKEGSVRAVRDYGRGKDILAYSFETFNILTKAPGAGA